jgi:hypothetical protein
MHKALPHNLWLHTATASPVYVHEDQMLPGTVLDGAYRMLKTDLHRIGQ